MAEDTLETSQILCAHMPYFCRTGHDHLLNSFPQSNNITGFLK